jgi:hypothetical protein
MDHKTSRHGDPGRFENHPAGRLPHHGPASPSSAIMAASSPQADSAAPTPGPSPSPASPSPASASSPVSDARPRRRSAWPWVVMVAVIVLASSLLAGFVFWRIETWPARTASDIASVFERTFQFQPQVTVEQNVILEQVTRTAELATAQRTVVVEREYENRWLLSTKRLRARGTFVAKAGFDLNKGVEARADRSAGSLQVVFPAPELLTVSQERVEMLEWDNGLWNKLSGAETEEAVNELAALANQSAEEQGLLDEARASVEAQIAERLSDETGLAVEVRFRK